MNGGIRLLLTVAGVLAALFVLVPLLKTVISVASALFHFAAGLFWLSLLLAIGVFVVGLYRRLMRS